MWYVLQENDELKVKIEVCTNQKKRLSSEVVDTNTYLGTSLVFVFSTNVDAQGLNEEYRKIGMEVFHAFSGLKRPPCSDL